MKELANTKIPLKATRQAMEVMAMYKDMLILSLRFMHVREKAKDSIIENLRTANEAYKELSEFLKTNDEYEVIIQSK